MYFLLLEKSFGENVVSWKRVGGHNVNFNVDIGGNKKAERNWVK